MLKSIRILKEGLDSKPVMTPFRNMGYVVEDKRLYKKLEDKVSKAYEARKAKSTLK